MGHPTKKKRSNSITSSTSIGVVGSSSSSISSRHNRKSSNSSTMAECPVCNMTLSKVPGSKSDQEHIKNCLENQNGNSVSVYKYVGEQNRFLKQKKI